MTDVRAPETDPFDPAAERDDQPRPGPSSPGAAFGLADWLKWAWRQLTSMRIALILLFLLALASVPGSMLPQQGGNPSGVQQYYTSHPALAPWLNRLGLFNVFAAPWFAAIYLLLFASLVGCVVPRTFRLAGSARTLPPRAPRHLARLPRSAEYTTALPPQEAVEVAARVLSGRGFRLRRPDDADRRTGSRRRRGTCARRATCSSTWPCSACWCRWRSAGCSVTRRTGCWCRARASPTP